MPLEVSDLTGSQRQGLLDHMREKLGDDQYEKLLREMGADRLLEAFLSQAASQSTSDSGSTGSSSSCWVVGAGLVAAFLSYLIGLSWLGEPHLAWHYLAAVPLGAFWLVFVIYPGVGLEILARLFRVPWRMLKALFRLIWVILNIVFRLMAVFAATLLGIGFQIWLFSQGYCNWMLVLGAGYLFLGMLFAYLARKFRSPLWSINGTGAYWVGIGGLLAGGILFLLQLNT